MDCTHQRPAQDSEPEKPTMPSAAAILLAAGASQRMGAVKALLPLEDGAPAVCRLASLYERFVSACVVVTGYHAEGVEAALAQCGSGFAVRNPAPEQGQLSSLQCGFRALRTIAPGAEWILFAPVDCFDVDERILEALLRAMHTAPPDTVFCIPEAGGKHGHPVALRRRLVGEFLALPITETARTVVHRHRERTCFVPVSDRSRLSDYDTPEEFAARLRPKESLGLLTGHPETSAERNN